MMSFVTGWSPLIRPGRSQYTILPKGSSNDESYPTLGHYCRHDEAVLSVWVWLLNSREIVQQQNFRLECARVNVYLADPGAKINV